MISISSSTSKEASHHTKFIPWKCSSIDSLCNIIINCSWSPCVFKDNYRLKDNFIRADWIALDFDDGWPLWSAIETCKANDLTHIIGTSKSHRKEKHGKDAVDRYRVVLKLERPIVDKREFSSTWYSAWNLFCKRADKAAKDPSRFFFPCVNIVSVAEDKCLGVSPAKEMIDIRKQIVKTATPCNIDDLMKTVRVPGKRNTSVYLAAQRMAAAGWSEDDAVFRIKLEGCTLDDEEIVRAVRNGISLIQAMEG